MENASTCKIVKSALTYFVNETNNNNPTGNPPMDLLFRIRELQRDCNSGQRLLDRYGPDRGRRLQRRLTQISAAPHLGCFAPPYAGAARCREQLRGKRPRILMRLDAESTLLLEPLLTASEPLPAQTKLDWHRITAVKLLEIDIPCTPTPRSSPTTRSAPARSSRKHWNRSP
jgi:hypothetical protein